MKDASKNLFSEIKSNVLNIDPVAFCQNNLTLDGQKFRLEGSGYKPFADIYRYIGITAVSEHSKPVVLVKGRQVGATTMAAALECYFMACGLYGNNGRSPMRVMHLFPTLALSAVYTKDKLNPIISAAKPVPGVFKQNGQPKSCLEDKLDNSGGTANNTMHYKRFIGGNQIWIESPGHEGDRVRGRTVDCIFSDEVQDIGETAIGAAIKTLTQAKYGPKGDGIQVYFGTPKQKGGSYWKMWQNSSQQYYHLRCSHCDEYFPLYRPDVNWEDVWLYGFTVKCTHCGHEQDKNEAAERGKWIPVNKDSDVKMIGYHINQLYIPTFSKEKIIKQKPEVHPTNTERIYMNEVLGEFFDGEGGTITKAEIEEKCADRDRAFVSMISPGTTSRVYAGFDWGQKANLDTIAGKRQGQSYSCGVILTVHNARLFHVDFATRLIKNDPQSKLDVVEEMFRRYSVHLGVGDIGDAWDLTHNLQENYGERFLASRAAPKVTGHVKYNADIFPREIVFERDYYISELFGLLRGGAIKFPWKSLHRVEWLIDHCCSMEVKVTRDRSGDPIRRFVKGSSPNDGFMALLNAYLAWKFDITQKFTIRDPQRMKYETPTTNQSAGAITAYMPRW